MKTDTDYVYRKIAKEHSLWASYVPELPLTESEFSKLSTQKKSKFKKIWSKKK